MKKLIIMAVVIILLIIVIIVSTRNNDNSPSIIPGGTTTVSSTTSTPSQPSKDDLIMVENLRDGQKISSPITITGKARGNWYFEASFPIKIINESGATIGSGIATAQGDWMTTDYVPFSATIEFQNGTSAEGEIILQKDNPSGLPENNNELRIPVKF